MSAAPAAPDAAPKGGGNKKFIIIIVALVVVLVLALGGAAVLLMKKNKPPAEGEEGADAEHEAAPAVEVHKPKPGTPPAYVPLDPFTVNLADKDADRFAQIGVSLEVTDAKTADTIKAYMPAIRSNVLMVLSHKTAAELLTVEGKEKLARDIRREASLPLGIELEDEDEEEAAPAHDGPPKKKKKKKKAQVESPIQKVLFSTFIVQ